MVLIRKSIRDVNGALITDLTERQSRWADYHSIQLNWSPPQERLTIVLTTEVWGVTSELPSIDEVLMTFHLS